MAITFRQRSPTGQQTAGISFRPRTNQQGNGQALGIERLPVGALTSAVGGTAGPITSLINRSRSIGQPGEFEAALENFPSVKAHYKNAPKTAQEIRERGNVAPDLNPQALRERYAQARGLDPQSLEAQNPIESGINWVSQYLPQAALAAYGAPAGGGTAAARQALKTGVGAGIGGAVGAPVLGAAGDYLGGETGRAIGETVGSIGGSIAGAYGANLITDPRKIIQQGYEIAKEEWKEQRGQRLSVANQQLTQTTNELQKNVKQSRKEIVKARNDQIKDIDKRHKKVLNDIAKGEAQGGQLLNETKLAGRDIVGSGEKLKAKAQDLLTRKDLFTTAADEEIIERTANQLINQVESGTFDVTKAQEGYQNLGKQMYGQQETAAGNVIYRSPKQTAPIKQMEAQNALKKYILENLPPKDAKKWLKANKKYSVAQKLKETTQSPEYKADLSQMKRDAQSRYANDIKATDSAYKQELKLRQKEYKKLADTLKKETYPEFKHRVQQEAIKEAMDTKEVAKFLDFTKKQGIPLSTMATVLHKMGLPKYAIIPILGVNAVGINQMRRVLSVINDNPVIGQQIKDAAMQAVRDNPQAFVNTFAKIVSNISGT